MQSACQDRISIAPGITIGPGKRGGRLYVRDLKISVHDVLYSIACGRTIQETLNFFPELTTEDVLSCLAFEAEREYHITAFSLSQLKEWIKREKLI